jgi:hypothetical protein
MAFNESQHNRSGWTVISGRRGFGEIFNEYKIWFIVLGVTLLSAALTVYLYLAGPLAVSRFKTEGITAIGEGDYDTAIQSLKKADRHSYS